MTVVNNKTITIIELVIAVATAVVKALKSVDEE